VFRKWSQLSVSGLSDERCITLSVLLIRTYVLEYSQVDGDGHSRRAIKEKTLSSLDSEIGLNRFMPAAMLNPALQGKTLKKALMTGLRQIETLSGVVGHSGRPASLRRGGVSVVSWRRLRRSRPALLSQECMAKFQEAVVVIDPFFFAHCFPCEECTYLARALCRGHVEILAVSSSQLVMGKGGNGGSFSRCLASRERARGERARV
jgi:hypothetical protein